MSGTFPLQERKTKVFSATDIGQKRTMNQDFVFASDAPVGNLPNLFVVADGMGGHNAGDFASRYGVSVLVESVRRDANFNPGPDHPSCELRQPTARFLSRREEMRSMEGMGTTMVVATVVGQLCLCGKCRRQPAVSGRGWHLLPGDAGSFPDRGDGAPWRTHSPSRREIIRTKISSPEQWALHETVKIDFFDIRLEEGNQLLMCSDGLSNMVTDEEIFETHLPRRRWKGQGAGRLIDKANANGGKDNIAVIVVEPFTNEVKEC